MTDGGDHGSQMSKVTELLEASDVDLLLIGIGNPHQGAPIPIDDASGERTFLCSENSIIYTQLDDSSLRDLAVLSRDAEYVPVGNQIFDLGQIYAEYVAVRNVSALVSSTNGVVIYKEAALFFVIPALLLLLLSECWGSKGVQWAQALVVVAYFSGLQTTEAVTASLSAQFAEARQLYTDGSFAEAEALFSQVAYHTDEASMHRSDLAAVQFNRGLCLFQLSLAESEASAEIGLRYAQQAQLAFLAAKRYAPQMKRSGIRLESISTWVADLQARITEEAAEQYDMHVSLQQLVEWLQDLLEAQVALRKQVAHADVDRRHPRRAKRTPRAPPINAPADASTHAALFVQSESELTVEAERIHLGMQELDAQMAPSAAEGEPVLDGLLGQPLQLMVKVPIAMKRGAELLESWDTWPAARAEQRIAEQLIEDILSLLGNRSSDESEEGEWDEIENYDDYEYSDEMGESLMSSMSIEGDLAAGGEMQTLPVPNYSAEDILMEEQGSLQFRQQQRARANAGKVEKDY
jgi:hypothetical protein